MATTDTHELINDAMWENPGALCDNPTLADRLVEGLKALALHCESLEERIAKLELKD